MRVSAEVYEVILPSLVIIQTESASEDEEGNFGLGSGVIVSTGAAILTALLGRLAPSEAVEKVGELIGVALLQQRVLARPGEHLLAIGAESPQDTPAVEIELEDTLAALDLERALHLRC